ncbi:hypothetical protein FAIPA1_190003 [Frankia sp. AiPs1]
MFVIALHSLHVEFPVMDGPVWRRPAWNCEPGIPVEYEVVLTPAERAAVARTGDAA